MLREREVPRAVLMHATEASEVAEAIAEAGVTVVVTDIEPRDDDPYLADFDGRLAAELAAEGVPIAIAGGGVWGTRSLALRAAFAVGCGLPRDAALRAITLEPARILGIDEQHGSLTRGKAADVLITSGDLFSSDTRVLRVMRDGRTIYEVDA
jgi:imidazolonepropionase-like amidohydrolase